MVLTLVTRRPLPILVQRALQARVAAYRDDLGSRTRTHLAVHIQEENGQFVCDAVLRRGRKISKARTADWDPRRSADDALELLSA